MNEDVEQVLLKVSEITEFNDMSEFLQDTDIDTVMNTVIKIIAKPNLPAQAAIKIIVELQAISCKFNLMADSYMYVSKPKTGTPEQRKKAIYKATADHLDDLVAAIKYVLKA